MAAFFFTLPISTQTSRWPSLHSASIDGRRTPDAIVNCYILMNRRLQILGGIT